MVARASWRRRWLVLLVSFLVCGVGWPVVYIMPNRYEVTAQVYLDTQTMLTPLLQGIAVNSDVMESTANILRRALLSRPFLEKVARNTDLDLTANTPQAFEELLIGLQQQIKIDGGKRNQIYTITYQNKDPQIATKIVKELLNLFVEGALSATRQDNSSTQKFLDQQIELYASKLEQAENKLKDFKKQNVGLMPRESGSYFTQLNTAKERLNGAKLELDEAKNRRDSLMKQISALESGAPVKQEASQQIVDPIDARIQSLETKLDELLFKFTEEHPDVIATRRVIAELKAQKAQKEKQLDKSSANNEQERQRYLSTNPIYQQLTVSLGKAEAEVAGLQVRYNQYNEQVISLEKLIETMPQVEAELAKMNRDYDVLKQNYEEMVKRRESARITREAEVSADDVKFNIIEPPRVPLVPIGPPRVLLFTGVLIMGIGLGIGLIWLLAQLRPVVYTTQNLKQLSGLPVFGAVSMVFTPKQLFQQKLKLSMFAFCAMLLIAVYGGLVVMQFLQKGLVQL